MTPATEPSLQGLPLAELRKMLDFTGAAPSCSLGIVKLHPAKQYLRDYYQIPGIRHRLPV